ncbi:MAG: hypothetical protein WD942_11125 [Dehalococcoidia bacterium]
MENSSLDPSVASIRTQAAASGQNVSVLGRPTLVNRAELGYVLMWWRALFEAAAHDDDHDFGDLHPHWICSGAAAIERHILAMPLSRDHERWERLRELLTLYRLAFGQPRQEDLLTLLSSPRRIRGRCRYECLGS